MTRRRDEPSSIVRQQALRLKRFAMGLGGYACTLVLVLAAYLAGQIPVWVVVTYTVTMVLINAVFITLIRSGLNLRLSRPDMTLEQVLASIVPGLFVIYHVESAVTRAAFLLLALMPLAFGILGLDTRRSLLAGMSIFTSYVAVVATLLVFEPSRISPAGDIILLVAFLAAILQISLLGGYINALRSKLRSRNEALNDALTTIEKMANHDELTGTYNRRYLLSFIEQETQRCGRGAEPFSLVIFDVDHFKDVNDRHGHLAGDAILAAVAGTLNRNTRVIDCFGRYGGEEFLLIMPQTDAEGAGVKAERLRAAVSGLCFDDPDPALRVTISGGVAEYWPGEPFTETLARADVALYRAKALGRDRIVIERARQSARA